MRASNTKTYCCALLIIFHHISMALFLELCKKTLITIHREGSENEFKSSAGQNILGNLMCLRDVKHLIICLHLKTITQKLIWCFFTVHWRSKRLWGKAWGVRRWTEQQIMTSASICWALQGGDTFNLPPLGRHGNLPLPIVLVTSAFGWLKDECSTSHMGTEQTSHRPLYTHSNTAAQMATDTLLLRLQSRHSPLRLTSQCNGVI